MGRLANGSLTNAMWVMELNTYTWSSVELSGDIPAPRYGAAGSLERFVKPGGTAQPMLIMSHGYGENGPLSDTFKCSFHPTDPYKATWRRMRKRVGSYEVGAPHPAWMIGSTFTSARDLVMFSGCYAGEKSGGVCPSADTWLLKYDAGKVANDTAEDTLTYEEETDSVDWHRLPRGPLPRVGGAMAQGLNAFRDAYVRQPDIAVLYSGSQERSALPTDHIITMGEFDGGEINILSISGRAWLRERVVYEGPEQLKGVSMIRRRGSTMSIVRRIVEEGHLQPDEPNEFFLLFGGELENGSFTNALLKLSFDPFLESERVEGVYAFITRPFVHGVLMFVSWGILMIIAAYIARYRKDVNGRSRYVLVHVCMQVVALAIGWAGIGVAVYGRRRMRAGFAHAHIGHTLIALASLQPVVAVIGILTQMRSSPRLSQLLLDSGKIELGLVPCLCKMYHTVTGFIIILLGAVNITLGLFMIVAPTIIWVQWIVYSGLGLVCALWLEVIGGRQRPAEQRHTGASSVNRGMSRGSCTLGRMMRSMKAESTADLLCKTRRNRRNGDEGKDEISMARSLEEEEEATHAWFWWSSRRESDTDTARPWDGPDPERYFLRDPARDLIVDPAWNAARDTARDVATGSRGNLRKEAEKEMPRKSSKHLAGSSARIIADKPEEVPTGYLATDVPRESAKQVKENMPTSRSSIDVMQERMQDVLELQSRTDSMLESREGVKSAASLVYNLRGRLDSGVSSAYTYQDPDSD